jgi:hypothetical protein
MGQSSDRGRFARVIASDLVHYFRAEGSSFEGSEEGAKEIASNGLCLLRARFGDDDALERYYADCIGSAFESLSLTPPSLGGLREAAKPFTPRAMPAEMLALVFGVKS